MTHVLYPDRRFQLWEYRVSHGGLLIRSPRGTSATNNIDLIFDGVELVCCARMMRGLEVVQADAGDVHRAVALLGEVEASDQVFVLVSEGVRHVVVASSLRVSEHEGDIFDSPF